ncbi:MAG: hypothetical protein IKD81_01155 [Eubacteriaceae bacterium]|nr:hypothetical protein [Eubacteriaceae bacterium]MCR4894338.1 hypothetical protein [Eubacteriales bacterium]
MNLSDKGKTLLVCGIGMMVIGASRLVYNFIRTGQPAASGLETFLLTGLVCTATLMLMASWRVE